MLFRRLITRDCDHKDPKIRGLALRSLCNMRSHLTDHMVHQTTIRLLDDKSPYVRKTALFALLKLHQANEDFIEKNKVVDKLYSLLKNSNTSLLSAVIHVLNELMASEGGMVVNNKILVYLLNR